MFNKVLILCIGNICRSPLAENMLAKALPDMQVDSAGLGALVGYPADQHMQTMAQHYDIDLSHHCAKQVSNALVEAADLTFVMDAGQLQYMNQSYAYLSGRVLLLSHFSPPGLKGMHIEDPYKKDETTFRECARQIALHVDAISKTLLALRR